MSRHYPTLADQMNQELRAYRGCAIVTPDGKKHRITLPSYEEGYRIGSLASRLAPWEALGIINRALDSGYTLTEKGR